MRTASLRACESRRANLCVAFFRVIARLTQSAVAICPLQVWHVFRITRKCPSSGRTDSRPPPAGGNDRTGVRCGIRRSIQDCDAKIATTCSASLAMTRSRAFSSEGKAFLSQKLSVSFRKRLFLLAKRDTIWYTILATQIHIDSYSQCAFFLLEKRTLISAYLIV